MNHRVVKSDMDEVISQEKHLSQEALKELVSRFGTDYPIEVIDSAESPRLAEVAALDKKLFGEHKSLSTQEFRSIVEKGGVIITHIGPNGVLISEASLTFNADSDGPSPLERALPEWLAYCDGAAVDKEYRGKGLQKQLLNAREAVAKTRSKEATAASVRHRNVASIRSMISGGYIMIADSPKYYGTDAEDARVIMLKDFAIENPFKELDSDHEMLEGSLKGVIEPQMLSQSLASSADVISIAVHQSDEVDQEYNDAVAALLGNGYIGVSCNDIDVGDSDSERADAMTFIKIGSLPPETAEAIRLRQKEIQAIVG